MESVKHALAEGEKVIHEGRMWYYNPPATVFEATWRPGRLYLTNKRLIWCDAFFKKLEFQTPLDRITKVKVQRSDTSHLRDKMVLILEHKTGRGEVTSLFTGKDRETWLKAIREVRHPAGASNPRGESSTEEEYINCSRIGSD